MNWDAIGALSDLAGAVGVVISLLYLALQIRGQNLESRLSSVNESARQWNEALSSTSTDPALIALWIAGLDDFNGLDTNQRAQFSAFAGRILRVAETLFEHQRAGQLNIEAWDALIRTLQDVASCPGWRQWWKTRAHWYTESFQTHINQLLEDSEQDAKMYRLPEPRDAPSNA